MNMNDWIVLCVGILPGIGWAIDRFYLRKKRQLSWAIKIDQPLLPNLSSPEFKSLKLMANDRKVNRARIVIISLKNTGNTAILPEDFDTPLTFLHNDLFSQHKLVGYSISKKIPNHPNISFNMDDKFIGIRNTTWNTKQLIEVTLIFADYDDPIRINGLIKNGELRWLSDIDVVSNVWFYLIMFILLSLLFILNFFASGSNFFSALRNTLFLAGALLGLSIFNSKFLNWPSRNK